MEARQLKREVEALIGDYIGQKLRETSFDPKGKGTSTMLDELAHYDLAISVALWWLDKDGGQDVLDGDSFGAAGSAQYPNRLERKAMILSSFAGIIMNSLPVEEILALYRCRPAASYPNQKCTIVYPFTLSYHPFAMLGSYKAVYHSKKHSQKLKRWLSEREKASAPPGQVSVHSSSSSSSSSSHSFLSDNSDRREDRAEHYEGSLESLHD
ncbi:uncharacterized protein C2orf80 isoform X2 [Etheostoma spectabile]|uniref:uncharacterized protein C2orf80 isoform X2 n=1 Tax=Etheostoma spectabile TaxID=54343 RepID=UPI0013AEEBEA|nr:uncharacterized protein C2orf80 homolog isoform X2 [Etheostoma spectabile]